MSHDTMSHDTKETLTVRDLVSGLTEAEFYRQSEYWRDDDDGIGSSESLGQFDSAPDSETADLVSHRYLSGSDYSGGVLVKSNRECFEAMLGDLADRYLVTLHGGYGTEISCLRLAEPIDSEDDETTLRLAIEAMLGLSEYPVLDESHYSETETDAQAETFDSCYSTDWTRALANVFPDSDGVEIDDEKASALFWESSPEWGDSDSGPELCSDLDSLADRYSPEYLLSAGVATIDADAILDLAQYATDPEFEHDRESAASEIADWIRIRNGARVLDVLRRDAIRRLGKGREYSIEETLRTHTYGDTYSLHRFWRYGPDYSRRECEIRGEGYRTDSEPFVGLFATD